MKTNIPSCAMSRSNFTTCALVLAHIDVSSMGPTGCGEKFVGTFHIPRRGGVARLREVFGSRSKGTACFGGTEESRPDGLYHLDNT